MDDKELYELFAIIVYPETPEERDDAEAKIVAHVRDLEARIGRLEALAEAWESQGERDIAFSKTIRNEDISITYLTEGAGKVENARHIRAALTATEGAA